MYMMPYNSLSFDSDFDFKTPFDQLFKTLEVGSSTQNFMSTDVLETENGLKLIMDLPGMKKEDIKIELDKGYLTISASSNKESEQKDTEGNYLRKERYSGKYMRSFYVGNNLKQEDVKAKFENGMLTLNFPKSNALKEQSQKLIDIEG